MWYFVSNDRHKPPDEQVFYVKQLNTDILNVKLHYNEWKTHLYHLIINTARVCNLLSTTIVIYLGRIYDFLGFSQRI